MASPFSIFRRHQKALTITLTALAMFAFVILDAVTKMDTTYVMPLLLAVVFAGAFWLWGLSEKKGNSHVLTGAAIGLIIGLLPNLMAPKPPGISTSIGTISDRELFEMRQARDQANQFIYQAFSKRKEPGFYGPQEFLFGGGSAREIVQKFLLLNEAKRHQISISDQHITDFIKKVSDNQLSKDDFRKIRTQLDIGETELYDLLREELSVRIVGQVLNPSTAQMPEQFWSDYKKFAVKNSIDVVEIPVEAFASQVAEPSEADLKKLFEEFKTVYPTEDKPGFRQPPRRRLAWFEADYESMESQVGDIPEDELKKRYEERKDTFYKVETLPESTTPILPDQNAPILPDQNAPILPNQNAPVEKPTNPAKPADEAPADPAKPADEAPAEESKPVDAGKASEESSCDPEQPADDTEPAAAEKPATAEQQTADKPAPEEKPEGTEPAAKTDAAPSVSVPAPADAEAAGGKPAETEIVEQTTYRPFDEVRDEIRDMLLREKAMAKSDEKIEAAVAVVREWRDEWRQANPDKKDVGMGDAIATKAEAYAAENGLKFVAAKALSYQELSESAEQYPIAGASEPFDMSMLQSQRQPQSVLNSSFATAVALCLPAVAENQAEDTRYAWWIAEDVQSRVAEFGDEGVKEQVEKAWRTQEARPNAQKRADALVELVRAGIAEKTLSDLIQGETLTGAAPAADATAEGATPETSETPADEPKAEADSDQLSVISSPAFSWLRQSRPAMQMNFWDPPSIEFGVIPGVEGVDDNFMKTVFDMQVGDVAVVPNYNKSSFYVVHLKARTPSTDNELDMQAAQQEFMTAISNPMSARVYQSLAGTTAQEIGRAWYDRFLKRYNVDLAVVDSF